MLEEADRSGVAQPPIKAVLEGAVERHDTIVVGYGPPGSFPTKIPANFPNGL